MEYNTAIREKFGKWDKYFREFIESEAMDTLFRNLKSCKTMGKKVAPLSNDLFKVFQKTDPDNLKVIIAGYCPYHTFTKEGTPVADGLALSCSYTKVLQPSLSQLYSDLENTYSDTIDVDMIHEPDLSYLSAQGVLLYNVALTTEQDKAGSHLDWWSEFNKYMWTKVINQWFRGIPVVFLGTQAAKSANLLTPMLHYPFIVSHPASAAYSNTQWSSDKVWLKVDKILEENFATKISWYMRKEEGIPWL